MKGFSPEQHDSKRCNQETIQHSCKITSNSPLLQGVSTNTLVVADYNRSPCILKSHPGSGDHNTSINSIPLGVSILQQETAPSTPPSGCPVNIDQYGKQEILKLIDSDYSIFSQLPEIWRSDREVVLKVIRKQGDMLRFASIELMNDREMVDEAIRNGLSPIFTLGRKIENASSPSKKHYSTQNITSDQFSKAFPLPPISVMGILSQDPSSIQFAPYEVRSDRNVILNIVKVSGLLLKFASPNIKNDRELVREAISNDPYALEFASKQLKTDPSLVVMAICGGLLFDIKYPTNSQSGWDWIPVHVNNNSESNDIRNQQISLLTEVAPILIQNCNSVALLKQIVDWPLLGPLKPYMYQQLFEACYKHRDKDGCNFLVQSCHGAIRNSDSKIVTDSLRLVVVHMMTRIEQAREAISFGKRLFEEYHCTGLLIMLIQMYALLGDFQNYLYCVELALGIDHNCKAAHTYKFLYYKSCNDIIGMKSIISQLADTNENLTDPFFPNQILPKTPNGTHSNITINYPEVDFTTTVSGPIPSLSQESKNEKDIIIEHAYQEISKDFDISNVVTVEQVIDDCRVKFSDQKLTTLTDIHCTKITHIDQLIHKEKYIVYSDRFYHNVLKNTSTSRFSLGSYLTKNVRRVFDSVENCEVILKILIKSEVQDIGAFYRMCTTVREISSKYVISYLDFGELDQDHLFITMPCAECHLEEYLLENSLQPLDITHIFNQICHGVSVLHQNNIIHRDLKPENILLFREGNKIYLKISDFEDSKLIAHKLASVSTDVGTVEYLAPESCIVGGSDDFTNNGMALDSYSLGCILFRMLTKSSTRMNGSGATFGHELAKNKTNTLVHEYISRSIESKYGDSTDSIETLLQKTIQLTNVDRPTVLDIISAIEEIIAQLQPNHKKRKLEEGNNLRKGYPEEEKENIPNINYSTH